MVASQVADQPGYAGDVVLGEVSLLIENGYDSLTRAPAGGLAPPVPGDARRRGSVGTVTHLIDRLDWDGRNAKAYQVRQVLDAIAKLEAEKNEESDDDA